MKFVPHAAAISMIATQSLAGGLSDEIVEAPVMDSAPVVEPAGSSNWIIPVLILGALAAVALSGDDDEGGDAPAPVPGPMPAPLPAPMPAPLPAPMPAPLPAPMPAPGPALN